MSQSDETLVGKIIHERLPIEWMRYNMFLSNNKYKNIPMLVFRVQASCPDSMIEKLKNSVNNFEGKLNWIVFKDPLSKKGNYLLSISELEELYKQYNAGQTQYNQMDFWGIDKYKDYCDCAIQDIPMLAKHIAETL